MPLQIVYCALFTGVGIAVFALMSTCIILSDVLARYAATERSLSIVFVILRLNSILAVRKADGVARDTKQSAFYYLNAQNFISLAS